MAYLFAFILSGASFSTCPTWRGFYVCRTRYKRPFYFSCIGGRTRLRMHDMAGEAGGVDGWMDERSKDGRLHGYSRSSLAFSF